MLAAAGVAALLTVAPAAVAQSGGAVPAEQSATQAPAPAWWYTGPPFIADPAEGPFELEFRLGAGYEISTASGIPAPLVTPDITPGLILDSLINRLSIYRQVHERLIVDFDYDASRSAEGFFEGDNFYALDYVGQRDEFVRRAAIGNRNVTIPGDSYVDTAAPVGTSVAAVGSASAALGGGDLKAALLARLGSSESVVLNYSGLRRVFDIDIRDTEHVRRQYFFLPDTGLDIDSIRLYRSDLTGEDLELGGREYRLLQDPGDYSFDPGSSLISLRSPLGDDFLAVTYTVSGVRVGGAGLGGQAFIETDGTRVNFSEATHPDQFDQSAGGIRYLYLNREGENSYWEHRGVYSVPELARLEDVYAFSVELFFADSSTINASYAEVLQTVELDSEAGLVIFSPEDDAGLFYPRPFPGRYPFTHPTSPVNPFDPANPVYGDLGTPEESDSTNTLNIRFSGTAGGYVIDELFLPGSVSVTVDGRELASGEFTVDEFTGEVQITADVPPEADVVIRYLRSVDEDETNPVFAAISADWSRNGLLAHLLVAGEGPLPDSQLPRVGEERPSSVTSSGALSYSASFPGGLELSAGTRGALRVRDPNAAGDAIVADMEAGAERPVSLQSDSWQLATRSSLLTQAPASLALANRAKLLYVDYFTDSLLGAGLRTLDPDNAGGTPFDYEEKAGPYNSADSCKDNDPLSLVLDFRFADGVPGQYASVVTATGSGLDRYDTLELDVRGDTLSGGPVRLYVEILQEYDEDLDEDGDLDGEESVDDEGYAAMPTDGAATVIGTGRGGGSNGVIDSEDVNGNGRLDVPAGGLESGALVTGAPDVFALEVSSETSNWQTVRLDLRPILQSTPAILEDAEAIRLTVVPASLPAAEITGRLVINRIGFVSTGVVASDDGQLSLKTVSPSDDDNEDDDNELEITLDPPLADGSRTYVAFPLGGRRDLTVYESLDYAVYVEDPAGLPAELELDVTVVSASGSVIVDTIDPGTLAAGWNEFSVSIALITPDIAAEATEIQLGVSADGADVTGPLSLRTDDWILRNSRTSAGGAAAAFVELRHPRSDLQFTGQYEYESAGFDVKRLDARHEARAEATATIADLFPVLIAGRWHSSAPFAGDYGYRARLGIGFESDQRPLPVLSHRYQYGTEQGAVEGGADDTTASVRISQSLALPVGVTQQITAIREASKAGAIETRVATLADTLTGSLAADNPERDGWSVAASGSYTRSFRGNGISALSTLLSAYAGLMGGALRPVTETLTKAGLERTAQSSSFTLSPPADLRVGVAVTGDEQLSTGNYTPAGTRDLRSGGSLAIEVPIGLGPEAAVRVTPSISRDFSVSLGGTDVDYDAAGFLAESAAPALMPPFFYLTPFTSAGRVRERVALEDLVSGLAPRGAPSGTVSSEMELETRAASERWFVPSLVSVGASGETQASLSGLSQKRSIAAQMSRSAPIVADGTGAGSFVVSSRAKFTRDYLQKTEQLDTGASVYYAFSSVTGRSWQINQNASWVRTRQDIDADRLRLFPDAPGSEPEASVTADTDRLSTSASLHYTWRSDRVPSALPSRFARRLGLTDSVQTVTNRERLAVDSSVTIADPGSLGTTTQIPLRVTLEHSSRIDWEETFFLELEMRAQGGVERRLTSGLLEPDLIPDFGVELNLSAAIRY